MRLARAASISFGVERRENSKLLRELEVGAKLHRSMSCARMSSTKRLATWPTTWQLPTRQFLIPSREAMLSIRQSQHRLCQSSKVCNPEWVHVPGKSSCLGSQLTWEGNLPGKATCLKSLGPRADSSWLKWPESQ
eukprot:1468280-Pleurochrysis_carterae.AAC.2